MKKLCGFLLMALIVACKKEDRPLQQVSYGDVESSFAFAEKPEKYYALKIDGAVIIDSLPANGNNRQAKYIQHTGAAPHQVQLLDLDKGIVVIDSILPLKTREQLHFIQLPGERARIYTSMDDGKQPPEGYGKLQFYYTDASLPDSIRVNVYLLDASAYPAVSTLRLNSGTIKKGAFSAYYLLDERYDAATQAFGFQLLNAATGDTIQPIDMETFAYGLLAIGNHRYESLTFKKVHDDNLGKDIYLNEVLFGYN